MPSRQANPLVAEVQIRAILGEHYLTDSLNLNSVTAAEVDFMLDFIRNLGLSGPELDGLVADAEQLASDAAPSGSLLISRSADIAARTSQTLNQVDEEASTPDAAAAQVSDAVNEVRVHVPRTGRAWRRAGMTWRRARPETVFSQWLKASALGDKAKRDALNETMKRTREMTNPRTVQIMSHAFELLVRSAFPLDVDVRDIAVWVAKVRERYNIAETHMMFEALVRAALGEDLPIDDFPAYPTMMCRAIGFYALAQAMGLTKRDLDGILSEAEDRS
jgi:hypothetical protein